MSMPVIVPSITKRDQSITDLIESTALQETSLAHILNAEGEKLQKVIAMPNITTVELLTVNKSVENMIKTITKLESLLQSNLELFNNCTYRQ